MDTVQGRGEWDELREHDTYTIMRKTASGKLLYNTGDSAQCCDDLGCRQGVGVREVQEDVDLCTPVADSHGCMAETNTTLETSHPPIKNKFKTIKEGGDICIPRADSRCCSAETNTAL